MDLPRDSPLALPCDLPPMAPLEALELPDRLPDPDQDHVGNLSSAGEPCKMAGGRKKRKFSSLPHDLPDLFVADGSMGCSARTPSSRVKNKVTRGRLAKSLVNFLLDVSQRLQTLAIADEMLFSIDNCQFLLDQLGVCGSFVRYLALRRWCGFLVEDRPGALDFVGWGAMPWALKLGGQPAPATRRSTTSAQAVPRTGRMEEGGCRAQE